MDRTTRIISWVAYVSIMALLVCAAPAWATDVPVTDDSGFGTQIASVTSASPNLVSNLNTVSPPYTDFDATVTESVFLCSAGCSDAANGTYTYVFTVQNSASSTASLTTFNTSTNGFTTDAFDSSANYGIVGSTFTTGGSPNINAGCQTPTNGFCFGPSNLKLYLGPTGGTDLPAGDQITFYAQSLYAPLPGTFTALNDGSASASVLDPGPEPGTMLLFGTGILLLGVALRLRILAV